MNEEGEIYPLGRFDLCHGKDYFCDQFCSYMYKLLLNFGEVIQMQMPLTLFSLLWLNVEKVTSFVVECILI